MQVANPLRVVQPALPHYPAAAGTTGFSTLRYF